MAAPERRILEPASPLTEEAIIGAACYQPNEEWLTPYRRMLGPECFTRPLWRDCWVAIESLWEENLTPDPITVAHRAWRMNPHGFANEEQLAWEVVRAFTENHAVFWMIPAQAKTLADLRLRRDLILLSADTAAAAHQSEDAEGVKAYTERMLDAMDAHRADEEDGTFEAVEKRIQESVGHGESGISTGIPDWDHWLAGGFREGETHVVGGPTGAGKTFVAVQVAATAALAGHGVAFLTLDTSPTTVWTRLFSVVMGRAAYRMRGTGAVWSEDEWAAYGRAKEALTPRIRVYRQQRSVAQVRAVVEQYRPAVVVVDYVQLMDAPRGTQGLYESATTNATNLQAVAQRSGAVLVLVTQMSREAIKAGRYSGIPGGMDSGRIDQVADSWILVSADEDGFAIDAPKVREGPRPTEPVRYRLDGQSGGLVPVGPGGNGSAPTGHSLPRGDR